MKKLSSIVFQFLKSIFKYSITLSRLSFNKINSKKRYAIPFYTVCIFISYITILIKYSGDSNFDKQLKNKFINDVTQINPIQIGKEIKPTIINEIVAAIKSTTGPISIGGGRYSMGGQIGFPNSLHIDMRNFNKVLKLDTLKKQITVQPGIRWRDIQKIIDPHHLSIKIMQTYANFTVGGSISVNCHGRYIGHGPIISSVLELKLVTANGDIITANRNQNQEVFNAAIGGYGGIGVIVEATLQLVDNVKVERQVTLLPVSEYNSFFNKNIRNNKSVVFQNGDLYPPNYDQINNVSWTISNKQLTDTSRVTLEGENYWLEHQVVELTSYGDMGKWFRKKVIDPIIYSREKIVWRNKEASYDVAELEPKSREKYTYVLQEYFIPVNKIQSFIPKMKAVFNKYDVNVLNVSLRHAFPDNESYLSWASEEVFAFVVYFKQGTDQNSKQKVHDWTVEMTDAILSENGKWYLPYQPHASVKQFNEAYPNAKAYFAIKNKYDSTHRFNNTLLDKYNPYLNQSLEKLCSNLKDYNKNEEQSILSVPEWYLVFNPNEYVSYLESSNNNPSHFPFYKSINEYWSLYDRSIILSSKAYPKNEEYTTMLNVIGISITIEYVIKSLYENTVGAFFGLFSNGKRSDKELTILNAHKAYGQLIYDKAWYEFKFLPWIAKVWSAKESNGSNFIRKWERTLFFTCEFSCKALYAQLIEWAAKASYSPVNDFIYAIIETEDTLKTTNELKVCYNYENKKVIGIKRWSDFTKVIDSLSKKNINFINIAGNDEIIVSLIVNTSNDKEFHYANHLYNSNVLSNNKLIRKVYHIPVIELLNFVRFAKSNKMIVEHIYDY